MKTDNELIAEFMGIKWMSPDGLKELSYDTSWDWLMPVVEKIESDPLNDICIFKEATQIRRWNGNEEIFDWKILEPDGSSKIAHVYRAVLKYIQWHNSQL